MVTRLTVDEFFDALAKQRAYPLVDTPRVREIVARTTRALCADYPIKDRWPVLDLESAYEGYLNGQPELVEWHRNGYNGTVKAGTFANTYDLNEWFDDFRVQWNLVDTPEVRNKMLSLLPHARTWRSPSLYEAHQRAVKGTMKGFLTGFFR